MWQNKIYSLWKSIREAREIDSVCEFLDSQTSRLVAKSYSNFKTDLVKLELTFANQRQLKIVVLMEKSYESLLLIVFCLLKGHCFIPIPPKLKSARDSIEAVQPDFIISKNGTDLLDSFSAAVSKIKILNIEDLLKVSTTNTAPSFAVSPLDPDQIAYIISTSGTTGKPKLIPISFGNFDSYILNISNKFKSSERFRLIQNFEISFDPYLFDLIIILFNKGCLVPLAHSDLRKMSSILDSPQKSNYWISLTPTQGELLLSMNSKSVWNNLEKTFFLGEKLKRSLCENWRKVFPNSKIYNLYGPAEATVSITGHEYDPQSDLSPFIPIGPIHTDHRFEVTSEGELLLQGPQVFKGYLNSAATLAGSWFNTHDLVEFSDSKMYVVGRSDSQVKINGRRLEIQELEIELEINGISGYVVPVYHDDVNRIRTTLMLLSNDKTISSARIYEVLIKKFDPDFIPKMILFITNYPLSQNGKIDRKQLEKLALALPH